MLTVPTHIKKIAADFWNQVPKLKLQPPYDIAGAVSLILPLDIVSLCDLTLQKIDQWLSSKGISVPINVNDRHLHGFVLVNKGTGFIFINGTDVEEERLYTIAHEASHFILDYKIPRDKAINKIGNGIENVLDGLREATVDEQVEGIIHGISIRPFTHLLEKEGDGSFGSIKIFDSENNADALAIELLAPHAEVIKTTLNGKKLTFSVFDQHCLDLLISKYKLPEIIAKQYSKRLAYAVTGGPSIMNKLGF